MIDENESLQLQLEELAINNTLIRVMAGSHAYGTNLPTSDWDERGIFTDIEQRIICPFEKIEEVKLTKDDVVLYELSKYMKLLLEQNPNILEILWVEDSDILFINDMGKLLREHRKEFLTLKTADSYIGYAQSQLKRIKGHNKWINSPQPEKEPEQKDFLSCVWNFSEKKEYNKTVPIEGFFAFSLGNNQYSLWDIKKFPEYNLKNSWIDKRGKPIVIEKENLDKMLRSSNEKINPDLIIKVNMNSYEAHHKNWKDYWNWKKNRNEKRSVLEEQFGYDTKHAMHLIRLLKSGVDILTKGVVPVKRDDAQYLLDIRNGMFTYEELIEEGDRLAEKIKTLKESSKLPLYSNYDLAKELLITIYKESWRNNLNLSNKKQVMKK